MAPIKVNADLLQRFLADGCFRHQVLAKRD